MCKFKVQQENAIKKKKRIYPKAFCSSSLPSEENKHVYVLQMPKNISVSADMWLQILLSQEEVLHWAHCATVSYFLHWLFHSILFTSSGLKEPATAANHCLDSLKPEYRAWRKYEGSSFHISCVTICWMDYTWYDLFVLFSFLATTY